MMIFQLLFPLRKEKRYRKALREVLECLEMNEDRDEVAIKICREALGIKEDEHNGWLQKGVMN